MCALQLAFELWGERISTGNAPSCLYLGSHCPPESSPQVLDCCIHFPLVWSSTEVWGRGGQDLPSFSKLGLAVWRTRPSGLPPNFPAPPFPLPQVLLLIILRWLPTPNNLCVLLFSKSHMKSLLYQTRRGGSFSSAVHTGFKYRKESS